MLTPLRPSTARPCLSWPHILHYSVLFLALLPTAHPQTTSRNTVPDALYRAGYEAYGRGDLARAHACFARLVRLAPRVAVGHAAYGEVLLAQGDPTLALTQLELAHQLDPTAVSNEVAIAHARLALNDAAGAARAFTGASQAGARLSADDSRSYATALALTGQADRAVSVLQAALDPQTEPAAPDARNTTHDAAALEDAWGALLAQTSDFEQAIPHLQAALARDPDLASAHAHLGSVELAQQQPEAAIAQLRRATQLAPGEVSYAIELGRALTASRQDAEAITVLRRALVLAEQGTPPQAVRAPNIAYGRPARPLPNAQAPGRQTEARDQARYALALALQAGGRPGEALPLFAAHAAVTPADTAALTNYALALVQTGDAKRAVALYQQALAHGPDSATLREDYGVAYLQQSDLDHALEQFRAGLALEPDNPHLHYDLGLAYKLKDNLAAAIPEFERAEQLDPTLPDPPYTLGVIHMQQGEFAAAAAELEKATMLNPENSAAWAVLGNVYKQNDQPLKATVALRRAIALDATQPSTHISLAAILAQAGDQPGAAAERRQAADLSRAAVSRQRASFALKSGLALLAQGKLPEAEAQLRTAAAADPKDPAPHQALADLLHREGRQAAAALERGQAAALTVPAMPLDKAAQAAQSGVPR